LEQDLENIGLWISLIRALRLSEARRDQNIAPETGSLRRAFPMWKSKSSCRDSLRRDTNESVNELGIFGGPDNSSRFYFLKLFYAEHAWF
jgi:hypothetical protein